MIASDKTFFGFALLFASTLVTMSPAAVAQQTGTAETGSIETGTEETVPVIQAREQAEGKPLQPHAIPPQVVVAKEPPVAEVGTAARNVDPQLRFNFSGAGWKDVLEWFAEQADLSLQIDQVPIGSVNFVDPTRTYSASEGLDILNRLLLDRGYALVRRGRMLLLIDLEVDNASKIISEMAELVTPEQLDERGNSDIVRCLFALGSLSPDAAREELAEMIGPSGRVIVLESARQVVVTETASKLRAIRMLLESAAMAESDVVELVLKHRGADEILEIARPLLGLEAGTNANDEIRISVGLYGDRMYATGLPGKVSLLESVVTKADQPLLTADPSAAGELALPVLDKHAVTTADVATVFDVLQTLLAGTPDARIAIDPKTNSIVASARPETQQLIAKTIAELEGSGQDFKVLNLRRLEPSQALLTINKFFGVTESGGSGPIVDGDPVTGKLWIRGTTEEIALIEKLISELEGDEALGVLGDKVRILPYSGRAAEDALDQVKRLWPITGRRNEIRTYTPARSGAAGMPERRATGETDKQQPSGGKQPTPDLANEASLERSPRYHFVSEPLAPPNAVSPAGDLPTTTIQIDGADIIVQFSPAGMIIASEDLEALDAFEALMQSVAEPSIAQSDLPTIIWLKYAEAGSTAELISSILGGSETTVSSMADSVMDGLGGGMLGLLGMGGGGGGGEQSSAKSILTTTGSVSIVPDARLNALIVRANPTDMQVIEMILEKIDRQESPEDVETVAKPALIPVIYQNAADIADVVKSIFGERITGAESGGRSGGGGQPSPQDFINAIRGGSGGRGGRGGNAPTSEPAKISVAVDAKSNSLVVIATPQDFEEVRQLVSALDRGGMDSEESIVTYQLGGDLNPEVMRQALESILGTTVKTTAGSTSSGSSTTPSPDAGSSQAASDIARRIEAARALGFGRGGPGGGGGPGGAFGRGGGDGGGPGGGGFGRGGGLPGSGGRGPGGR